MSKMIDCYLCGKMRSCSKDGYCELCLSSVNEDASFQVKFRSNDQRNLYLNIMEIIYEMRLLKASKNNHEEAKNDPTGDSDKNSKLQPTSKNDEEQLFNTHQKIDDKSEKSEKSLFNSCRPSQFSYRPKTAPLTTLSDKNTNPNDQQQRNGVSTTISGSNEKSLPNHADDLMTFMKKNVSFNGEIRSFNDGEVQRTDIKCARCLKPFDTTSYFLPIVTLNCQKCYYHRKCFVKKMNLNEYYCDCKPHEVLLFTKK